VGLKIAGIGGAPNTSRPLAKPVEQKKGLTGPRKSVMQGNTRPSQEIRGRA